MMEITDKTLNRTTYFEKLAPEDVFKCDGNIFMKIGTDTASWSLQASYKLTRNGSQNVARVIDFDYQRYRGTTQWVQE